MAERIGGGRTVTSPGHPEIVGHLSEIQGGRLMEPSRGKGCLNFGTFLANPTSAWKWPKKYWAISRVYCRTEGRMTWWQIVHDFSRSPGNRGKVLSN